MYVLVIIMWMTTLMIVFLGVSPAFALKFDYLDPLKLQTVTPPQVQQRTAMHIIRQYTKKVSVKVNPKLFRHHKDVFHLTMRKGVLHINASTGVAAVWGFNYYLKKYCTSQIEWQTERVKIPNPLPAVDEVVVANDRFRYYQDTSTVSYSFVWWNVQDWIKHVTWMALNGINLTLAPVAQEAIWQRIYRSVGMTQHDIDRHFTGPAFLSWLRLGNLRGWGGPLPQSWHIIQSQIQDKVINTMLNLGIVPVLPAFNGHVPVAFQRIFPAHLFYRVHPWSNFSCDYSCGLFVKPTHTFFKTLGAMFLTEMGRIRGCHIYISDPFNEVDLPHFNKKFVTKTVRTIFSTLSKFDDRAVWLIPNWMFISKPDDWPKSRVKAFLHAVPKGRALILDLQAESSPRYNVYDMYFGQPFIWCMLHNFGGTLGMYGNMATINREVFTARYRNKSTMIGIGLTPEGINQNYVVYDLMLENGWRKNPVKDLDAWVASYAERRYGCSDAAEAWSYLLKSVYSYNPLDGPYTDTVTRKPSFNYYPSAWYSGADLFEAFHSLIFVNASRCNSNGFHYDVVDVTRQVLQYKIEQLFAKIRKERHSILRQSDVTVNTFLDAFDDLALILATDVNFRASVWFTKAKALGHSSKEADLYEYNAWNQITRWGPNGELNDYAAKQWSEMILNYYRPGWAKFLRADAMVMDIMDINQDPPENKRRKRSIHLKKISKRAKHKRPYEEARRLYYKWLSIPGIQDLPMITTENPDRETTTETEVESIE